MYIGELTPTGLAAVRITSDASLNVNDMAIETSGCDDSMSPS